METIRKRRMELGYSLSALSRRSGVSTSFISEIETGVHNPSWRTLEKIVGAMSTAAIPVPSARRRTTR